MDKITDKLTQKVGWDTNERSKSLAIDTLSRDLEDDRHALGDDAHFCLEATGGYEDALATYLADAGPRR